MNFQQETYIDSLKDHYEELCLAYDEKIELCKRQDTLINDNDKLADQHELLVSEVADLQGKVQNLQHSKAIMEGIKAKKNMKRKLSFHNMKVYHQLSDNALKLQSRLSMKNELIKNLKIAEKEVEGLRKRIENSQQKIKLLKQEVKVQESYSKQHEPELMQLNHMFQKLNIRLYALYQEKDDLLELLSADVQDAQDLDYEEDETVQIPDWSSRISEIKKEKDLISEENRRLKEKISKWNFSP
jgi:L-rhamnose mutarotase